MPQLPSTQLSAPDEQSLGQSVSGAPDSQTSPTVPPEPSPPDADGEPPLAPCPWPPPPSTSPSPSPDEPPLSDAAPPLPVSPPTGPGPRASPQAVATSRRSKKGGLAERSGKSMERKDVRPFTVPIVAPAQHQSTGTRHVCCLFLRMVFDCTAPHAPKTSSLPLDVLGRSA